MGWGAAPATSGPRIRTSREAPDETPAGTTTGCQDQADLKGGEIAPEPRQRGGVVRTDRAAITAPVFFPFRSADVGVPKVAAAGASTAPFSALRRLRRAFGC